jgi:hypothetical protein
MYHGDVEMVVEPRQILEDNHALSVALSPDHRNFYKGYVFEYRAVP